MRGRKVKSICVESRNAPYESESSRAEPKNTKMCTHRIEYNMVMFNGGKCVSAVAPTAAAAEIQIKQKPETINPFPK